MAARARTKPKPAPVAKARAKPQPSPYIDLGLTSLKRRGGRIEEEWSERLRGKKKYKVYRQMGDQDSTCGGALNAAQVFLGGVGGHVKAREIDGVISPEAERIAQRFNGAFEDMEDTIGEMRAEIVKFAWRDGAAPMECTYKICRGDRVKDTYGRADPMFESDFDDGMIAWRSWSIRPLESVDRWLYDAQQRLTGLVQVADEDYRSREIPIEKILNFRFRGSKRSPEGESMFRPVERDYYFKGIFEEIEAITLKRDGTGIPDMQVPADILHPNATTEQRNTLESMKDLVCLMDRDSLEGIVRPSETDSKGNSTGFKLSLLSSPGSRAIDVGAVLKRKRGDISVGLGAGFMYAGMDGVGARSLDESKQDVFRLVGASILRAMKEVFDVAICDMARLNDIPQALWPEYQFDPISEASLAEFAAFVTGMLTAGGVTYDDELEAAIRAKAGLPARRKDAVDPLDPEATKEDDAPKLTADELRTMMTRAEVKAALRIGDKGLENHVAAGELPEYSIGGRRKYKDSDVHALVSASVRGPDEEAVDRVVEKVAKRRIPREMGVDQLVRFAGVDRAEAEAMMGEVGRTWFADAVTA